MYRSKNVMLLVLFGVSFPNNNTLRISGWKSITASKNIRRSFLYCLQVKK